MRLAKDFGLEYMDISKIISSILESNENSNLKRQVCQIFWMITLHGVFIVYAQILDHLISGGTIPDELTIQAVKLYTLRVQGKGKG